jgi:hypothetical protein
MSLSNEGLIPLVAYNYQPKNDEFVDDLLGETVRRIFCTKNNNNKYSEKEKNILEEYHKYLKEINYILPPNYTDEDILRQLQGNDYKIKNSHKEIVNEIEWKKINLPIKFNNEIQEILNTGFAYVHGRDKCFRPLIFFNPGKYDNKKFPFESWQKASEYFIEFLIQKCLIPGRIENWNIIVDCHDLSMTKIPWDLQNLFKNIKGVYRCRLYKLYLLNLTGVFNFIWNICVKLIGQTIEKKATKIETDKGKYTNLFKLINKNQVEKKYGGNADNVEIGKYFPLSFQNNEYYSESEEQNDKDGDIYNKIEIDNIQVDGETFYEMNPKRKLE